MPVDMSRYPANWREISLSVRERAGQACEFCHAPNGQWIYRDRRNRFYWYLMDDVDSMQSDAGAALVGWDADPVRIILTVHHLGAQFPDGTPGDPHDKMDCRDENLVACCQRCHLLLDLESHKRNAAATRRRKYIERTGQQPFDQLRFDGMAVRCGD